MNMRMQLSISDRKPLSAPKMNGQFPKKAVLLSPHTNEVPAVALFRKSLVNNLISRDVECEFSSRRDMMDRIWKIRKFVSSQANEINENFVLNSLLTLEDHVSRLSMFSKIFQSSPKETIIAELHAMSETAPTSADSRRFLSIPNTNIVVCTDVLEEFSDGIQSASQTMKDEEQAVFYSDKERFNSILTGLLTSFKEQFNLDAEVLFKKAKSLLEELMQHSEKIRIFELPSSFEPLPPTHEMYPVYFKESVSYPGYAIRINSMFEEAYAIGYRNAMEFTPADITAVLELMRFN